MRDRRLNTADTQKKCKVLVVSQYNDPTIGGAERYLREVASRLALRPDMTVNILTSDYWDGPGKALSPGCFRFMSASFHPAWLYEAPAILKKCRPDVIYAHYTLPGLLTVVLHAARKQHIPVALMYHSDITGFDFIRKSLGGVYFHLMAKGELSRCAALFVGTDAYARTSPHLSRIKNRFVTAPPGVDPVMAEGKRAGGKPYILFVGKPDVPAKGFFYLMEAFRLLKKTRPGLELAVIGGLKDSPVFREDGVRHVGYVHSRKVLAGWYASAAVTVLPSMAEPFGMVLVEALVAGCPVVATRSGGNVAFVVQDENGCLCEPKDSQSLFLALEKALERQEILRENIRAEKNDYLNRYNWNNTAATVASTLLSIGKNVRG